MVGVKFLSFWGVVREVKEIKEVREREIKEISEIKEREEEYLSSRAFRYRYRSGGCGLLPKSRA